MVTTAMQSKPFIKWAGGKTQLLPVLLSKYNQVFSDVYVEPFLGGGAMLLSLLNSSQLSLFSPSNSLPSHFIGNDGNSILIALWRLIQQSPDEVVSRILDLQQAYNALPLVHRESFYLAIRSDFNSQQTKDPILFLFLNKTAFNGLYRVNSKGELNVGWNKSESFLNIDIANIYSVSKAIQGVQFTSGQFDAIPIISKAFYYLDPPYKPISETASFNQYLDKFGDNEQVRVKTFCDDIHSAGGRFMVSNSDCPFLRDLWREYSIDTIQASRRINSKGDKRGSIAELLITNF